MSKKAYYYGLPTDYFPEKGKLSSYSVSIPGFRTFLDPNQSKCKKVMWGTVMLAFLCISVFQICERAHNFLSDPIQLEYNIFNGNSIKFPSFTFCPYNAFLSKPIIKKMENHSVATVHDLLSTPDVDLYTIWNLTHMDLLYDLPSCRYEGGSTCNGLNYKQWRKQSTILGICHTMDLPKMEYYGISSAFMVYTNASANFVDGPKSKHYMVKIHNMYDDITYAVLADGLEVYDNTLVHINYFHHVKVYQNLTDRPCYTDEHYQNCRLNCFESKILKTSKCRLPFMKSSKLRLCSTPQEFRQIYPIPIQENVYFEDVGECLINCGKPCKRSSYDSNVETKEYSNKQNYVRFRITPLRGSTVVMKEKFSYSFVAFTCDVGAILGLYLGISVLSITEIIELLVDVVITKHLKSK